MDRTEAIVLIIVAIIGSSGFAALVAALVNRINKGDPLKVGVRLLLQDRIEWLGSKAINEERVSYEQKKLINAMHDCYHNGLHGNGDEKCLMEDFNELEVVYQNRKNKEEEV